MITSKTPFTPEDVQYDGTRLDALNNHFERLIKRNFIQSANYCLSRGGKCFANTAIGKQSFEKDDTRALQPNVIRGVASISKIFCASAIFKLIEDGYIRSTQPVREILQEFGTAPYSDITIAHLLSHTSGLYPDRNCFPNKYAKSPWDYIGSMKDTPWLEAGLSVGMYCKPGEQWGYCSFGFVILGEIIHRVTGMKAEQFIIENILKPCGMSDSGYCEFIPDDVSTERMKSLANRFYVQNEEDKAYIDDILNKRNPLHYEQFAEVPQTGGGMFATTEDLNKFGYMLMNNGTTLEGVRILGRKTVERMTENYTNQSVKDFCWGAGGVYRMYALGPDTRRTGDSLFSSGSYFHEGAGACCLLIDPKEQMVASWFVPFADDQWHAEALYNAAAVMWSGLK